MSETEPQELNEVLLEMTDEQLGQFASKIKEKLAKDRENNQESKKIPKY